ncbi:MAG: transcription termination factor Rho [Puniceicoccaceae bacterium]|nr:MAG: transcription termination factor Rho [Puniceicoccaceae bacterium]
MFTPGEIVSVQAGSDAKLSNSSSGDDEVTFSADIKVDQVEEKDLGDQPEPNRPKQPRESKAGHENEGKGHKPNHNNGPKNQHPNDRQKGNGKFNKNNKNNNKRKRAKNNRWDKNKAKRDREEETPIEFGELLEWEVLEKREDILALAEDLMSGGGEPLDYVRIYNMLLPELREEVASLGIDTPNAPNRDQLIDAITKYAADKKAAIVTTGILEILDDDEGGLIVYERDSYRVKALSAYVPQAFIKHYGLQRGHIVRAQLHPHREGESCPIVVRVESVMDQDPETLSEIVPFTERVPYYPTSRILMEADSEAKWDNLSMRVVDCLTPVGFGQRGLIVAPPRTGKTVLMQGMANSIQKNYPDSHLIILLIDERPEEVTDFRRQVSGEVISSTFDETAESHVHAAEMVIEKARRMVEVGKDVVILLDSITRLARAYNTTMPSSGKILSGGVEANALQKPKRFFGSARNIEDGGSLTIIATALVETGSKMDEVIFEEFKGTGNMELHLDRGLSDKRIFPALSMDKSGTRKEELLYHPDEMLKIYSLRRAMKGLPSTDAMEMLIQRIKKTNTNAEFLMSVAR